MYCYQKKGNALFFQVWFFSLVKGEVGEEEKSDFGEKFPKLMAQQYLGFPTSTNQALPVWLLWLEGNRYFLVRFDHWVQCALAGNQTLDLPLGSTWLCMLAHFLLLDVSRLYVRINLFKQTSILQTAVCILGKNWLLGLRINRSKKRMWKTCSKIHDDLICCQHRCTMYVW